MAVIGNCEPDPCSEHASGYRGLAGGGFEDFFCEGDGVPHSDRCAQSGGWDDFAEFLENWGDYLDGPEEACEHLIEHWRKTNMSAW